MILGKAVLKGTVMAGSSRVWWASLGFEKDGRLFLQVDPPEMILACEALGRLGNSRFPVGHWAGLRDVWKVEPSWKGRDSAL